VPTVEERPPWSHRRRRTLIGLAAGGILLGVGAIVLPDEYGITSAFLAALCGFLLIVATVVFLAIPGPDTLHTLLRTSPVAGAVLVVAVLLMLSNTGSLRWLWLAAAAVAGAWTAFAVWETRREGG
jgi:hypothetical protein